MNSNLLAHEQEQYEAILANIDRCVESNKKLLEDAKAIDDKATIWFCETCLKNLAEDRANLRKPGVPRR